MIPRENHFEIGDTVFLRLHPEDPGMVTGVLHRPSGVTYAIAWANDKTERWHYAIELTDDRSFDAQNS